MLLLLFPDILLDVVYVVVFIRNWLTIHDMLVMWRMRIGLT